MAASAANPRTFEEGISAAMPIGVAAGLVGMTFGVLAEPVMGAAATIAFSAIVFAGAAQFAALAVLAAGGGAVAAVAAGVLLNLRFLPMAISIAPWVRGGVPRRAAVGYAVNDAAWALSSQGDGRFDPQVLLGATVPQYPLWVLGTAVGVFAGDVIGDPATFGLDAIFPAFFLGLLFAEARSPRARAAALTGALIALALLPVAPPGVPVLAASLGGLIALLPERA